MSSSLSSAIRQRSHHDDHHRQTPAAVDCVGLSVFDSDLCCWSMFLLCMTKAAHRHWSCTCWCVIVGRWQTLALHRCSLCGHHRWTPRQNRIWSATVWATQWAAGHGIPAANDVERATRSAYRCLICGTDGDDCGCSLTTQLWSRWCLSAVVALQLVPMK